MNRSVRTADPDTHEAGNNRVPLAACPPVFPRLSVRTALVDKPPVAPNTDEVPKENLHPTVRIRTAVSPTAKAMGHPSTRNPRTEQDWGHAGIRRSSRTDKGPIYFPAGRAL